MFQNEQDYEKVKLLGQAKGNSETGKLLYSCGKVLLIKG